MSLFSQLLGFAFAICFIAMVFYVLFGQLTVRKLRKNAETREQLGIEFVSGWDIINVAQALSLPRSWIKKIESSSLSFLYSNAELLYKHTTVLDRVLARIFYTSLMISGLGSAVLLLLNTIGLLE